MTETSNTTPETATSSTETQPTLTLSGKICLALTLTAFLCSIGYPIVTSQAMIDLLNIVASNPRMSLLIAFGLLFVVGFFGGNEYVVGIGAVGFLSMSLFQYSIRGWYAVFTSGLTPEGIVLAGPSPMGWAVILASGLALTACAVVHLFPGGIVTRLLVGLVVFVMAQGLTYTVADHEANKTDPWEEKFVLDGSALSKIKPEDCDVLGRVFGKVKIECSFKVTP